MSMIDFVIPVYNEGKLILDVLKRLETHVQTPFRVLICYDHEEDTTLQALQDYQPKDYDILKIKNRYGKVHGAIYTGFEKIQSEVAIVYMADDTFNAGIVDQMYQKFNEGCEIVIASRFVPGGCMEGAPWLKNFLVRLSSWSLCHVARIPVHDATNGFRLFSKRILDKIPIESQQGFAFSIELLVKCHRLRCKIGEVPALWYERTQGKSRFQVAQWLGDYLRWYFYAFATLFVNSRFFSEQKQ